jgi:hypothetical protein
MIIISMDHIHIVEIDQTKLVKGTYRYNRLIKGTYRYIILVKDTYRLVDKGVSQVTYIDIEK